MNASVERDGIGASIERGGRCASVERDGEYVGPRCVAGKVEPITDDNKQNWLHGVNRISLQPCTYSFIISQVHLVFTPYTMLYHSFMPNSNVIYCPARSPQTKLDQLSIQNDML